MDLEPFKNKDSSIYKKEKIRFIWARIKLSIYNEIKRIRALPQVTIYANFGRRKRTLHLYVVTATNLVLKFRLRANAETSHSVRIGPGGGCERCGRWWKIFRWWDLKTGYCGLYSRYNRGTRPTTTKLNGGKKESLNTINTYTTCCYY